jgi:hypothetical protein
MSKTLKSVRKLATLSLLAALAFFVADDAQACDGYGYDVPSYLVYSVDSYDLDCDYGAQVYYVPPLPSYYRAYGPTSYRSVYRGRTMYRYGR